MDRTSTDLEPQVCVRLKHALTRRLYPHTSLRLKQITVGDRDSLVRWSKGDGTPSGQNLVVLIVFFWRTGDRGFLWEVLGIEPMPVCANELASEMVAVLRKKGLAA